MDTNNADIDDSLARAAVRGRASSAAIAAGLLLYFGFVQFTFSDGDDLFTKAGNVFIYVLRVGGCAMVPVALFLWTGRRLALLADSVVTTAIGALGILTNIVMLIDGGRMLVVGINFLWGGFFVTAGIRSGREFIAMKDLMKNLEDLEGAEGLAGLEDDPGFGERYAEAHSDPYGHAETHSNPSGTSLAGRLLDRHADEEPDDASPPGSPPGIGDDPLRHEGEADQDEEDDPPPPDGYLASFADEDPPTRP